MPLTSIEYAHGESALADTGRNFGLSGAALKWIAMITKLIDHIRAVVMEYGLYYQGGAENFSAGFWTVAMDSGCIPFSV